ncbi:MAG: hypothetical protein M1818_004159 [Claussenomyces sp. TS43310]|nr:MAG: hypothetical protein M1818_004159 [Claussenomyces sp. TS43310]
MGSNEYSSAVVGGGLKLKGSKPSGVTKNKKKKKKAGIAKESEEESGRQAPSREHRAGDGNADHAATSVAEDVGEDELMRLEERVYGDGGLGGGDGYDGKTPTERRHEEMRRKRLNERLLKTGAKTHKERVEELNKYLSNLSEHHDMPRIGPG